MITSFMSEIKGRLHLKRFEQYHTGAGNKIYFDYGLMMIIMKEMMNMFLAGKNKQKEFQKEESIFKTWIKKNKYFNWYIRRKRKDVIKL